MVTKLKNVKISTIEKCENKYRMCLKLYTFKVHPVINLLIFEKSEKTFFIANYSNFNFQNRGCLIKQLDCFLFWKTLRGGRRVGPEGP